VGAGRVISEVVLDDMMRSGGYTQIMLEGLKKSVCQANLDLVARGLVIGTWGNVSGVDRKSNCLVIKPSGLPYADMKPRHMVVVRLSTGEVAEGDLKPSSDTPTHLALYRAFKDIGGIVHTHSLYATVWAQAQKEIPVLGTTHADHFYGPVPCTRPLRPREVRDDYEANTGKVIVERLARLNPLDMPAVLVAQHGPFAWGPSVPEAVANAVILERVACMASETLRIRQTLKPLRQGLIDKHFLRKHGPGAYYGQT